MEGPYAAQQPYHGQQAPFFYYHPDPNSETRHHGQFTPHPHGVQYQQQMPPQQMQQAPEPIQIYAPQPYQGHVVCPQPQYQHLQHMPAYAPQALLTPAQSPRQNAQKPAIVVQQDSPYLFPLDTECCLAETPQWDTDCMPSTPPLSASGSAMSSPPSTCEVLPTPINATFSHHALEGVKAGCEEGVLSEILAGEDWTRGTTPPMTPGKHPPSAFLRTGEFVSVRSIYSRTPWEDPVCLDQWLLV
jgi:hypothetical protein